MDDFDIAPSKIGESAQRVVDRAIEESRRRDHVELTNEHVFLAFAQVEWDTFAQVMSELGLNPHEILHQLEEHLDSRRRVSGRDLRVAPSTKLVVRALSPIRPISPMMIAKRRKEAVISGNHHHQVGNGIPRSSHGMTP